MEINAGPWIDVKISGLFNAKGVKINMRMNSASNGVSLVGFFLCHLGTQVYV